MDKFEDIDFSKLTSEMMEDILFEEIKKMVGDDPKSMFIFTIGNMVGKWEMVKCMHAISEQVRDEMAGLMKIVKDDDEQ